MKVLYYFILSIVEDFFNLITDKLPFRRKLCWLFGHRYKGVWLKDSGYLNKIEGEGVIVADTERHGCVFCGHTKKMKWHVDSIDWERSL